MPYSQKVIDRFEAVTNAPQQFSVGRFDPNDSDVATGMAGAPACGDVMRLQLKLDENERIIDVKFKTYGWVLLSHPHLCLWIYSKVEP